MSMDKHITINYKEYDTVDALPLCYRALLREAEEATRGAYSPYSRFCVGAALLLADGTVVRGSNQENAAYPSGLCAERTAMFAAAAQRPEMRDYRALAIVGRREDGTLCEASPCGACRQVMLEYEQRQGHTMSVVMRLEGGRVRVVESVADLLPFSFQF